MSPTTRKSIEQSLRARSLKLAALQKTLKTPPVFGDETGDLLVIGWGSTKGAIEEAVEGLRGEGYKVSSLHLTFLQPLPPGIKEIMQRFKKVMTIEGNWSDSPHDEIIDETNRRYSALAMLLRSRYLVDVDCWSEVRGQPIKPGTIRRVLLGKAATGLRGNEHDDRRHGMPAPHVRRAPRARGLPGRRAALVHRLRRQRHPQRRCSVFAATRTSGPRRRCSSPVSAARAGSRIT